jgi:hypothetical protein
MNPPPEAPPPDPSARYQKLMATYASMHVNGDSANRMPAEKVFDGRGLALHLELVRQLCRKFRATSLIDYGCGKAKAYKGTRARHAAGREEQGLQSLWGLQTLALYDPAVRDYAALPERRFDAAVSTHVLEFTPEEDVDWVLAELFRYASRFVFLAIACHPSPWELPGGGNYHVTQRSPGWWTDRLWAARAWTPQTRCFALLHPSERSRILVEI